MGAGVGLVVAGPIVNALSYHWLFWLPLAALVVAALAARSWSRSRRCAPRAGSAGLRRAAAVRLAGRAAARRSARRPTWGWGSGRVIGLLVAAVVLAVLWVVVESAVGAAR